MSFCTSILPFEFDFSLNSLWLLLAFGFSWTVTRFFSWDISNHWKSFFWGSCWGKDDAEEILIYLVKYLGRVVLCGSSSFSNADGLVAFTSQESIDLDIEIQFRKPFLISYIRHLNLYFLPPLFGGPPLRWLFELGLTD